LASYPGLAPQTFPRNSAPFSDSETGETEAVEKRVAARRTSCGIDPIVLAMGGIGQGAKSTAAQRAEVVRLASEGLSVRRIALAVFGDARYRGRVERILRPPALAAGEGAAGSVFPPIEIAGLEWVEVFRLFLERRSAVWAASGKAPLASEMRAMVDLWRRLGEMEALERLKLRHRAGRGVASD
jgi:hypothetical protein